MRKKIFIHNFHGEGWLMLLLRLFDEIIDLKMCKRHRPTCDCLGHKINNLLNMAKNFRVNVNNVKADGFDKLLWDDCDDYLVLTGKKWD